MILTEDELSSLPTTDIRKPFKDRKSFDERKREVEAVRLSHENKLPVIIERLPHDKQLPNLDKCKFLIPDDLNMSDIHKIIRRRLQLSASQALFLLVNERSMINITTPLAEVYEKEKAEDGYLYVIYASQDTFGSISALQ